jgi:hypothetical protein
VLSSKLDQSAALIVVHAGITIVIQALFKVNSEEKFISVGLP